MADPSKEPEISNLTHPIVIKNPSLSSRSSKWLKISEEQEIQIHSLPKSSLQVSKITTVGQLCSIRNTGRPKRVKSPSEEKKPEIEEKSNDN